MDLLNNGDERPGRHTACMLALILIKWTRLVLEHKDYKTIYRLRHHSSHATILRRALRPRTHVPGDPAFSTF